MMKKGSYTGTGIALGLSFGFIFGLLLGDGNLAWGMMIGLCFGLVISTWADSRSEDEELRRK